MGDGFLDREVTRRDALRLGLTGSVALGVMACGGNPTTPSAAPASTSDATTPSFALIKSAQAEGGLTFYTASSGGGGAQVAGAFTAKYGIPVNLVVLASAPQEIRFTAEVNSGKVVADILQMSDLAWLTGTAIPNGWLAQPTTADVPAASGWPASKVQANSVYVVTISPLGITYNSDKVKGKDVPTQWSDLLNPKWKGLLGIDDLRANAVDEAWLYSLQTNSSYGESFVTKLAAQKLKVAPSPQLVVSVAAGDLAMYVPATLTNAAPLQVAGAPIKWFVPPGPSTGSEQYIAVTKGAPHPNAAKLFLNFALSQAGQVAYCKDVCSSVAHVTPPGTLKLPPGYQSPPITDAVANRAHTLSLIGLK